MSRPSFSIQRGSLNPDSSKNFLINGNFDFWQRGTSFPAVANLAYTADRFWAFTNAVGTVNVTRQDISALDIGSRYALRIERSAGTDVFRINQSLETSDLTALKGRDFTFSVLVRKSALLTSDVTLRISTTDLESRNSAIQDTTSLVIPNADLSSVEFRRFSVTFTIPGGSTALGIQFDVGANQLGAAGVYFEVAQAMVNYGAAPNKFGIRGESLESELANCQRFFEKTYNTDISPGTVTSLGAHFLIAANSANQEIDGYFHKVEKRAIPTIQRYSPISGAPNTFYNATALTDLSTGVAASSIGTAGFNTGWGALIDGNLYIVHWTIDAEL